MSDVKTEDVPPQSSTYPYQWSPASESELPLADFLTKYKPSMVQNDGTKPWIWVRGPQNPSKKDKNEDTAIEEAQDHLESVSEKVESIKNDSSIPVRSSKKTGAKSKKEVREAEQAQATEKFKEISLRTGYVSGKWLIFAPSDKVDMIWSAVATSLVSGPLSSTAAYLAKVATSPQNESPNYQHVLCIYIPDVYDKDAVTEVLKALVGKHGVTTLGVKSNLYTSIGLDSKHPSGIPSTAYFADLEVSKSQSKPAPAADAPAEEKAVDDAPFKAKGMPKPKLRKKAGADDPFASDSDGKEKSPAKEPASKGNKRSAEKDEEDGSTEENEKLAKKRRAN